MALEQFGRYQIRRILARGGMAELFLAEVEDHGQRRTVVLKRIRPDHAGDPEYRQFFDHEARLARLLDHPNVVHALDAGEIQGVPYVALEYVRGASALDLIRRAIDHQLPLSIEAILSIGLDLCAALTYVHELRTAAGEALDVVHRDVSPPNVVIGIDGRAHLVDFGVARSTSQRHATAAGVIKGKLAYLAPEQLTTRSGGELVYDHRADLFVLGTLLYELCTLRPLFRGTSPEDTLRQVVGKEVLALDEVRADVPTPVAQVIMRALAKDPAQRFCSGRELADDLREAARASGLVPSQAAVKRHLRELLGADYPTGDPDGGTRAPVRRPVAVDEITFDPLRVGLGRARAVNPPTDPLCLAGGTGTLARMRTSRQGSGQSPPTSEVQPAFVIAECRADTDVDHQGGASASPAAPARSQPVVGPCRPPAVAEPQPQIVSLIDERPTTALFLAQLEAAAPPPERSPRVTVLVAPAAASARRRRLFGLAVLAVIAAIGSGIWMWLSLGS
jgi:serine/threonine-protein kinase